MSTFVRYDTERMNQIARKLEEEVRSFQIDSIDKFFQEMANQIGSDESHGTWNGELAEKFISECIEPKRSEFKAACDNCIMFANNLAGQAKSWNDFETGA